MLKRSQVIYKNSVNGRSDNNIKLILTKNINNQANKKKNFYFFNDNKCLQIRLHDFI